MKKLHLLVLLFASQIVIAQTLIQKKSASTSNTPIAKTADGTGSIGIGTTNPNMAAMLDISSTDKGLLLPRVALTSTTSPLPLTSFVGGMLVYNTATENDITPGFYGCYGTSWVRLDDGKASLTLLGNTGTNPVTNFIGTTDDKDLVFKRNNIQAGLLGINNTSWGQNSFNILASGINNTSFGSQAMQNNTIGGDNTAVGHQAMLSNNEGNNNTAIGVTAMKTNATSFNNTVIGYEAGLNLTGSSNVFFGNRAGKSEMLNSNKLYLSNENEGAFALLFYGEFDTKRAKIFDKLGIGRLPEIYPLEIKENSVTETLIKFRNQLNTPKWDINMSPEFELQFNETGVSEKNLVLSYNYNIGIGMTPEYAALDIKAVGSNNNLMKFYDNTNTARWDFSLTNNENLNITSSGNTNKKLVFTPGPITGFTGLNVANPNADFHIKVSDESYTPIGSANPNTRGGIKLERWSSTDFWNILIDFGGDLNFNYNGITKKYLSNTDGNMMTASDLRLKQNIKPLNNILAKVLALQPTTYTFKNSTKESSGQLQYGFIAQDVEKVFPAFVATKGKQNFKGIDYQNFSVVAIQAIKEQQEKINSTAIKIQRRVEEIDAIDKRIQKLQAMVSQNN